MITVATLLFLSYTLLLFVSLYAWLKLRPKIIKNKPKLSFTIVVPFRNEAQNLPILLNSIIHLKYPKELFEVIFVNDQSYDNSQKHIHSLLHKRGIQYQVLQTTPGSGSPKKRAITQALAKSQYENIACTDADCQLPPFWLHYINEVFLSDQKVKFISGPVMFFDKKKVPALRKVWNKLQQIEFASLIGSGASSILLGIPNMCSGAHIAYKKDAFIKVGGYEGNEHIASGDDEFLLHKIAKTYPNSIRYLKNSAAVVQTNDQDNFSSFAEQRKRWASKWSHYEGISPRLVAVYIFFINALSLLLILTGQWNMLLLRIIPEFIFLSCFMFFFKKYSTIFYILPLQLIYPIYVIYFGIMGLLSSNYEWKNRKWN